MKNEEFLRLCKAKVAEYTNSHMDKTDGKQITVQDVYVVYSYVDGVKTYKGVGATLIGK